MKHFQVSLVCLAASALCNATLAAQNFASSAGTSTRVQNPIRELVKPHEYGLLLQGGNGLQDRTGFHFLSAGLHAGKVLTPNVFPGPLRGNFEYAVEVFPYWQAFTPRFPRVSCTQPSPTGPITCSPPYTVGGTFTGVSILPIILRYNFAGSTRLSPWIQGAGGVVWTNHKFPAYGDTSANLNTNGPNGETSVWNFDPQFGVGAHYFTSAHRSVDVSANAVHISSSSLGDRNPGVNTGVQFTLGYTWWK